MHNTLIFSVAIAAVLLILLVLIVIRRRNSGGYAADVANKPVNPEQIYIGNLHYRIRENDLQEYFGRFGSIKDLYIVKNRQNGRSKGYGFVTFDYEEDADKALDAHGELMNGRNLVVRIARQK